MPSTSEASDLLREHRIGVLGGSFDPVHNGHLVIARQAIQKHDLPCVLFVPNNIPPHKGARAVAPIEHRLEMVRLAIAGEDRFELSTIELERAGPSYSYTTVLELKRRYPGAEILFIVGSDCLYELDSWYRARELAEAVRFVVVAREASLAEPLRAVSAFLPERTLERIRADAVAIDPVEISSTHVRQQAAAGRSIRGLVPEPVRDYIERKGLYRLLGSGLES